MQNILFTELEDTVLITKLLYMWTDITINVLF